MKIWHAGSAIIFQRGGKSITFATIIRSGFAMGTGQWPVSKREWPNQRL
jgi:hypothetical protein